MANNTIITATAPSEKKWFVSILLWIGWGCAISLEMYFLVNDVSVFGRPDPVSYLRSQSNPVASLLSWRKNVQFQNSNALIWNEVGTRQEFFARQSLMTMSGSDAEIRFSDGTEMSLIENSLIQFESNEESLELKQDLVVYLLRGGFRIRENSRKVLVQTKEFQMEAMPNSRVVVEVGNDSRKIKNVIVHQGVVQIKSGSNINSISEGERAFIDFKSGAIKVKTKKIQVELIYPVGGGRAGSRGRVFFKWKASQALGPDTEIWISPRRRFRLPVKKIKIHQPKQLYVEDVTEPKKYYWKLVGQNKKALSEVGQFLLEPSVTPSLIYPIKGVRFNLNQEIGFAWEELNECKKYEIEIFQKNSKKVFQKRETVHRVIQVNRLNPGSYSWRVRGEFSNGDWTRWSRKESFGVLNVPLSPPELFDPKFNASKNYSKPGDYWLDLVGYLWRWTSIQNAHAEPILDENLKNKEWKVKLEWTPVKGAVRYKVQIARTRNFYRILAQTEVLETQWDWPYRLGMENSKGRVFYRVAVVDDSQRTGKFSEPKSIWIPKEILALKNPKKEKLVVSKKIKPIIPKKDEPLSHSLWFAGVSTGLRNFVQKSETTTLKRVRSEKPFIENRLTLGLTRQYENSSWRNFLNFHFAKFTKPTATRTTSQSDQSVWEFDFQSDYFPYKEKIAGFKAGFGGILAYRYRFEKEGSQSVNPSYGVSVGPHFYIMRKYTVGSSALRPMEIGGEFGLPLSGALTNNFYGFETSVWGEWNLGTLSARKILFGKNSRSVRDWIGLRSELQYRYHRWSSPSGTFLSSWAFWLVVTLRFSDPILL